MEEYLIYIIWGLIALIIIFLIYGYISNFSFKVTEYNINSKELYSILKDKKVVILSDLHNCSFGKDNIKLINKIYEISPAYIVVAGDMLNHKSKDNNLIAKKFIQKLERDFKIIYADGNHEQGFFSDHEDNFEEDKFFDFYETSKYNTNMIHLANEYIQIENIRIYGLQIARKYYRRTNRPEFNQQYLKKLIGKPEKNCYNILIAHNPMYFEDYVRWGADFVVSGHLHGGFLRLPWIGGVLSPQLILFPKYSGGMYYYKNGTMILSRGLGMHTIKLRVFNSPELIVVSVDNSEAE